MQMLKNPKVLEDVFGQLEIDVQYFCKKSGGFDRFISAKQEYREKYFSFPCLENIDNLFVQTQYEDYTRKTIKVWGKLILSTDMGINDQNKRQEEKRMAQQEEEQKMRVLEKQLEQVSKERNRMEEQYSVELRNVIQNNIDIKQKESNKITEDLAILN